LVQNKFASTIDELGGVSGNVFLVGLLERLQNGSKLKTCECRVRGGSSGGLHHMSTPFQFPNNNISVYIIGVPLLQCLVCPYLPSP